jgi:hypothetical protein
VSELTQVLARAQTPAERVLSLARAYGTTITVAVVVFAVAHENGGFGESTRDTLAIVLWWVLLLAVGLGTWSLVRVSRGAIAAGVLLAAFGLLALASSGWAVDAEGAYAEFTRVALYVAVFAVAVLAGRRESTGRWADGLALGIVAVTVVALISRFFPGTFEQKEIPRLLPSGALRLSYPVGYWNGLAILIALGIPLLLRVALVGRNPFVRGLALAPIPAVAAAIYLTSSRAGVATALIGAVAFLLITARRWAVTAALVVAGCGSLAAVLVLLHRHALVDGPLGSAAAESQGRAASLVVGGICVLTGLIYGVGCRAFSGQALPPRSVGWALAGIVVAGAVIGLVAAHPVRKFDEFRDPNAESLGQKEIQSHLLSASGNGRWQLWGSAIDEFESKPIFGRGAGSYEAWWLQHGPLPLFVRDAHSLYAETLGELGIVGFLLLIGAFLTGLGTAIRRLVSAGGDERVTIAALVATFVAFAVAAAVDWMWELTIVSIVGLACLGLAAGPALARAGRPRSPRREENPPVRPRLLRYVVLGAWVVGGLLVICAIAVPLLSTVQLEDSRNAVARGDLPAAARAARNARSIQPWAASPDLQLALVEEQANDFAAAHKSILRAISRARNDWSLWLIRSRLETELGQIKAARRSIATAKRLNPNSQIVRS